jgi:hypothetical protein
VDIGVKAGTGVNVGISVNVGTMVAAVGVQVGGSVIGADVACGGGAAIGPHEASTRNTTTNRLFFEIIYLSNPVSTSESSLHALAASLD